MARRRGRGKGGWYFYSIKQSWFFASSAQSYVVYQLVGCGGCGIKLKTGCYQQEIRRNRISLKRKIPQRGTAKRSKDRDKDGGTQRYVAELTRYARTERGRPQTKESTQRRRKYTKTPCRHKYQRIPMVRRATRRCSIERREIREKRKSQQLRSIRRQRNGTAHDEAARPSTN